MLLPNQILLIDSERENNFKFRNHYCSMLYKVKVTTDMFLLNLLLSFHSTRHLNGNITLSANLIISTFT